MEVPPTHQIRAASIRLLRGRGHDLEDATVGVTSCRSDLVSLLEKLRDCPVINEVIDAEARVALEEYQERMSRDHVALELKERKSAKAYTDSPSSFSPSSLLPATERSAPSSGAKACSDRHVPFQCRLPPQSSVHFQSLLSLRLVSTEVWQDRDPR